MELDLWDGGAKAAYKDLNLEPEPTEPLDEHQQGFVKILVRSQPRAWWLYVGR